MNETTVEQPAAKRLERSRSDRCSPALAGPARCFDIHPAFYRVGHELARWAIQHRLV
jgi:hypothetical protein